MRIQGGVNEKTAKEIVEFLVDSENGLDLLKKQGTINFSFAGVRMRAKKNDIVGNVLQEWLKKVLDKNKIFNIPSDGTQSFPDFYLKSKGKERDYSEVEGLCEIKSYNSKRTPAFDVANYDSYIEKLNQNVAILDTKYIIFAYKFEDGKLSVSNVFCKNIWEITGETEKESLKCQIKKGKVYNIRPVSFTSTRDKVRKPFENLEGFLIALYKFTVEQDKGKNIDRNKVWMERICEKYTELHEGDDKVELAVKKSIEKVAFRTGEKCFVRESGA
jgi:NgoBV restriction endonuclease.